MRIFKPFFAVLFVYACVVHGAFCAQKSPSMFSTYGEIQPVQKYSSNPFWNKNSPYNLHMPIPIYATGADLTTADCNSVVADLIASFCASNTCKKLSDVRPQVMIQLSQLPGHNFATSCGGYIDSEFEKYRITYGNSFANNIVKPGANNQTVQSVYNYAYGGTDKTAQPQTTVTSKIQATSFPKTIDDVSFNDRMALRAKGYEPFQDMNAYRNLVVEGEEHFIERQLALMEIERQSDATTMSDAEYCKKYPLDSSRCTQTSTTMQDVLATGDAKTPTPSSPAPGQPTSQSPTQQSPGATTFNGRTIGGGRVVVSNQTHGGSCYPAAKSDVFANKVLTTGQYESISPAFEKAMITVFRKEGKCGTIKNDPCGYTCYGIGSKCMGIDVENITRADAENIYYNRFWKKYNLAILPDVIAGDLFLASMASGPCTAIQQFREFLGLSKNCKIDDSVVVAVKNYNGDIHNAWLDKRKAFLTEVAARRYNNSVLKGWMNAIKLKRENGCHVVPAEPIYR